MIASEIAKTAKEITVALIAVSSIQGKAEDEQYVSKWVAQSYKIIYDAVHHPEIDKK